MTQKGHIHKGDNMSDVIVCKCRQVTEDTIVAAVKAGATTVDAVREATEATGGCGRCAAVVSDIIARESK